ncbi:N(6)-adenine-specific methyltransferase METTL4 [Thrips palmi]|uniref:N(6)-adenine-specific methyltransferase METTL4 n=1 Tax=Thrips palmi TaxID=161013 RepID=A0A6P8ZKT0_THRPL|nr:N(6)-adenine-specific methyltransferase METTL4 [Thrips palmi]
MSLVLQTSEGFVLCHPNYLRRLYSSTRTESVLVKLEPHHHLFDVNTPYMRDAAARKKARGDTVSGSQCSKGLKRKFTEISIEKQTDLQIDRIKNTLYRLVKGAQHLDYFTFIPSASDIMNNNKDARMLSENLYKETDDCIQAPFNGENNTDEALLKRLGLQTFVFPPRCRFYCRDVGEMKDYVEPLGQFDLILLDPPWWNKYIRRKKAKCRQDGYNMMYNHTLGELPLNMLLAPGGIIAVWCTNSTNHLEELKNKLFPAWGTEQIAQWAWLKVTKSGEPVCPFSDPPGKQPFEQLIFGVRPEEANVLSRPEDGKVFLSVPSAIHSHKPPVSEMLQTYLPPEPRCLEIFARYLLPNWTSWGLEVIKLQHSSLFREEALIAGDSASQAT